MDISLILLPLAIVLLIFMMFNSRRRMQKMKEEQEAKQRQTVPGAEVMLNSGLFGTIVAYDPDDLDKPAEIEIAPGVVIKAHTQAIARIIDPVEEPALAADLAELPEDHPDHIPAEADLVVETDSVTDPAGRTDVVETETVADPDGRTEVVETSGETFDADEMKTYGAPEADGVTETRTRPEGDNKQD